MIIKLISKRELDYLTDHGYIDKGSLKGVTVTSKQKSSGAKKHYVKDTLAFIAWEAFGYDPVDRDFQYWKRQKNKRS